MSRFKVLAMPPCPQLPTRNNLYSHPLVGSIAECQSVQRLMRFMLIGNDIDDTNTHCSVCHVTRTAFLNNTRVQ